MPLNPSFTPNPAIFNPAIPGTGPAQWQRITVTVLYTGTNPLIVTGNRALIAPWVFENLSSPYPITLNTGQSFTFDLSFQPAALGRYQGDVCGGILLLFTVSGGDGGDFQQEMEAQGDAVALIPVYPLNGTASQVWLAFTAAGPIVVMTYADPTTPNPEAALLLKRLYDFGVPIVEKSLQRWALRYIDNGIASISIQATVYRPNGNTVKSQTISIGTVGADGLTKTAYFDLSISGELFLIQISAAANAGNITILDMYPQGEPEGEYVENT